MKSSDKLSLAVVDAGGNDDTGGADGGGGGGADSAVVLLFVFAAPVAGREMLLPVVFGGETRLLRIWDGDGVATLAEGADAGVAGPACGALCGDPSVRDGLDVSEAEPASCFPVLVCPVDCVLLLAMPFPTGAGDGGGIMPDFIGPPGLVLFAVGLDGGTNPPPTNGGPCL